MGANGSNESRETLNIPKCHMKDFYDDLRDKLSLVTGIVNY